LDLPILNIFRIVVAAWLNGLINHLDCLCCWAVIGSNPLVGFHQFLWKPGPIDFLKPGPMERGEEDGKLKKGDGKLKHIMMKWGYSTLQLQRGERELLNYHLYYYISLVK
jgi:hypothetical protein